MLHLKPDTRYDQSMVVTLLPEAVQALGRLMREGNEDVKIRASKAILGLILRPPPGPVRRRPASLSKAIGATHDAGLRCASRAHP
jgi:hypothetical protein